MIRVPAITAIESHIDDKGEKEHCFYNNAKERDKPYNSDKKPLPQRITNPSPSIIVDAAVIMEPHIY
jgi:hypothetical protein